jgi:hypothetical protein
MWSAGSNDVSAGDVELDQVGFFFKHCNCLSVVPVVEDLNLLSVTRCEVMAVVVKGDSSHRSFAVLNVNKFTALMKTVNSTDVTILPADCNMEALVTELNILYGGGLS